MTIFDILGLKAPVWDKAGEGGTGGGGQENTGGEGGDTGGDGAGAGETGIGTADDQGGEGGDGGNTDDGDVALNGGTADGQDNSEGGQDGGDNEGEGEGDGEAPDEYDFTDVLPEGMEMDQGLADAVSPVFKDLGLSQEQANKLVEVYAGAMQEQAQASADAAKELVSGWKDTAKQDKEIGLNNWKDSVDAANAAIRTFGTPELVQDVMIGQGMGNHPEVIRMFSRIGKAIADDSLVTGEATDTSGDVDQAEVWYGATTPKSKKG